MGVCYVLDEPTSGLHPRDTERLLESLRSLRDAGNTVLVVEHDESLIRAADWVIDLGPGERARTGGQLLVEGPAGDAGRRGGASATARFLHAAPKPPNAETARLARSPSADRNRRGPPIITRADRRSRFPVGCLTCVTGGEPGSGKSTLAQDILARSVRRHLGLGGERPETVPFPYADWTRFIRSWTSTRRRSAVRPARPRRRSSGSSTTKIRARLRAGPGRRRSGATRRRFGFNAPGGACEGCLGMGARKIEMQFLADLFVTCEACRGLRYSRPTLEVRFRGLSIGEVLQLPRRRGPRRLRRDPQGAAGALGPPSGGAGLRHARPVEHHALGRRIPAREARGRAEPGGFAWHALRAGRADLPDCTRPTWRTCWPSSTAWPIGGARWS